MSTKIKQRRKIGAMINGSESRIDCDSDKENISTLSITCPTSSSSRNHVSSNVPLDLEAILESKPKKQSILDNFNLDEYDSQPKKKKPSTVKIVDDDDIVYEEGFEEDEDDYDEEDVDVHGDDDGEHQCASLDDTMGQRFDEVKAIAQEIGSHLEGIEEKKTKLHEILRDTVPVEKWFQSKVRQTY